MILGGVIVFVIASIIQSLGGSNMFSDSYYSQGALIDFLIEITFVPGWILTGVLILGGGARLIAGKG
jgi:hypothetical protein